MNLEMTKITFLFSALFFPITSYLSIRILTLDPIADKEELQDICEYWRIALVIYFPNFYVFVILSITFRFAENAFIAQGDQTVRSQKYSLGKS